MPDFSLELSMFACQFPEQLQALFRQVLVVIVLPVNCDPRL